MDAAGTIKAMAGGLAWRVGGLDAAGRVLLDGLAGDDEQIRMLSGMALVKAGDRSVRLIEEAVANGNASPAAVRLLADIGTPGARRLLDRCATVGGPIAEAATDAIDVLRRIEESDHLP